MEGGQLGFDLGLERLVRVTPARLGVWDDCPRRYRLTYLDRPAPPRGGPQAANTLGAVVHLALRALFELPVRGAHRGGRGRPGRRGTGAARASATSGRPRPTGRGPGTGWPTTSPRRWIGSSPTRSSPSGWSVGCRSAPGGWWPRGGWTGSTAAGDELVIVDYKTGRHTPDPGRRRGVAGAGPVRGGRRSAPCTGPATRWSCTTCPAGRSPAGGTTTRRWTRTCGGPRSPRPSWPPRPTRWRPARDPDVRFPARPAPRCASCPMRRSCPEGRAVGPEADPWAMLVP